MIQHKRQGNKDGVSNGTRAVFGGGYVEQSAPYVRDRMDYVTIAHTGKTHKILEI